ncbi:MAG: lasso peptide biosynthesis protein [Deltaproteobacteria bacterium]|nr:lasso peptide biosynthesis protein [Deltaproteobacteria bacterium]
MKKVKGRVLFNIAGLIIVVFWLVMLGLLVYREEAGSGSIPSVSGPESPLVHSAERTWKEIFFRGKKTGYSVSFIKPFDDGYFIQEKLFLKLNLMGLGRSLQMVTQGRVYRNFVLKSFHSSMASGIVKFNVSGKVEGRRLILEIGSGAKRRSKTLKIKDDLLLGSALDYYFRSKKLKVGDIFSLPFFDPSSMLQKDMKIEVTARETLSIHGESYDTFRLEGRVWGRGFKVWVDHEGRPIKESGIMGFTTMISNAERAPTGLGADSGVDLYEIAAVQVNRSLPDPREMTYLKLRLQGIDEETAFLLEKSGGKRQQFRDGILQIRKEAVPLRPSYRTPYRNGRQDMKAFLKPEFNIESDDEEIIRQAREIAGDSDNPLVVARRMVAWVYRHLEKRPVLSFPSAKEVLRTREGDCNEHAVLLTALLRASGIPSRIVVGLVYARGKFYYHAWTEAYLGDWITMDATLDQMPADVTHIKLFEGNLEQQARITGLIGELEISILDFSK